MPLVFKDQKRVCIATHPLSYDFERQSHEPKG